MKTNKDIIQEIYDFKSEMKKFDFCPTQRLINFDLRTSLSDYYGVVVFKDDKIYRAIYPHRKQRFIELYNSGILQILSKEGLIPDFKVSDFYIDGYPLLIEVEKLNIIHVINYTYSMIKEETKLKLRLLEILNEFGYTLIDGHTANATFQNGKPVFFDLGSFVKSDRTGRADYEIWLYNIIPLIFLSVGRFMSARGIYHGVPNPWLIPNVDFKDSKEVRDAIAEFLELIDVDENLKHKIKNFEVLDSSDIDVLFASKNYAMTIKQKEEYSDLEKWSEKNNDAYDFIINKICKKISNADILHLGCSTGSFLDKCVKKGAFKSVFGTDCNEFLLDYAFNNVKGAQLLFCNNIVGDGPVFPLKTDVVYVSGLFCDCILKHNFNLKHVLQQITTYVKSLLYIEFFPYGKDKSLIQNIPDNYTVQWFEKNFADVFTINDKQIIDTIEINGEQKPYRILYEMQIPQTDNHYFAQDKDIVCSGLSNIENWGRWSDGDTVFFRLQTKSKQTELPVEIKVVPFITESCPTQKCKIFCNNHEIKEIVFDTQGEQIINLIVPNDNDGNLDFTFKIDSPKSPAELGKSDDIRRLGIGFKSVQIKK